MAGITDRFLFACAPDSWGVLDYPGPSWEQSYEKMLDEMVEAGYTGTELGPYGFFPTDPNVLQPQLEKQKLKLLGSFVPVKMTDPAAGSAVIERILRISSSQDRQCHRGGGQRNDGDQQNLKRRERTCCANGFGRAVAIRIFQSEANGSADQDDIAIHNLAPHDRFAIHAGSIAAFKIRNPPERPVKLQLAMSS